MSLRRLRGAHGGSDLCYPSVHLCLGHSRPVAERGEQLPSFAECAVRSAVVELRLAPAKSEQRVGQLGYPPELAPVLDGLGVLGGGLGVLAERGQLDEDLLTAAVALIAAAQSAGEPQITP